MSVSRRAFIKHSAMAGAGLALSGCGSDHSQASQDNGLWRDAVAWDHAWDAADAITYEDNGENYDLPPAIRVDRVPDFIGDHDMHRDDGSLLAGFDIPQIPGPIYSKSSDIFNGRPSWYSDTVMPHDNNLFPYFYATHSCLTTKLNPKDDLNWLQPWWGAVLVRAVGPFEGHNHAYIDGNPGMTTIGRSGKGDKVQMRAWPTGHKFGPTIHTRMPYTEDTVLVQWLANGDQSWLQLSFRNTEEEVITRRFEGAIADSPMENFHSGFSHTNHTSAIGISKGVPTQEDSDRLVDWAAPYLPKALVLS